MHTRAQRMFGGLRLAGSMLALAACASCSVTHVRMEARPIEAVLEIRINGQWVTQQRTRYLYEKPMDEPYQTLPTVELEALERQAVAEGDEARALAIRNILECRKLGIVPEEE